MTTKHVNFGLKSQDCMLDWSLCTDPIFYVDFYYLWFQQSQCNKPLYTSELQVFCRICGDRASGFHYGVHSCEGCKVSWSDLLTGNITIFGPLPEKTCLWGLWTINLGFGITDVRNLSSGFVNNKCTNQSAWIATFLFIFWKVFYLNCYRWNFCLAKNILKPRRQVLTCHLGPFYVLALL